MAIATVYLEHPMRNPWTAKNPLLSLWLSGANTLLSYSRSAAIAEAQRQYATLMSRQVEQWVRLWTLSPNVPSRRRVVTRRKRRR
jgi:hypothetical protein